MPQKLRTFPPIQHIASGGFLHTRHRGVMYPPFMNLSSISELESTWSAEANDIIICTHQKVGTHLTKRFVVEILRRSQSHLPDCIYRGGDIGHDTVPWPEVLVSQQGMEAFSNHLERTKRQARLWYTHTRIEHMPFHRFNPDTRFLVVGRDARSVAVSQFFFYKNHPLLEVPENLGIEDFVKLFLSGDLYFGDYFSHFADWSSANHDDIMRSQVLTLSYEDLVQDKAHMVRKIAEFLVPRHKLDKDQVAEIVTATEFDRMKSDISANPQSFHFNPDTFFRAGTVNDWERHLSPSASSAIESRMVSNKPSAI